MENKKDNYYRLVLMNVGQQKAETLKLLQAVLSYGRADTIKLLATAPNIVAKGLVLQDAQRLEKMILDLGNETCIEEDESGSPKNDIFGTKENLHKPGESVLVKCRICGMMTEAKSLEMFCFTSCPHCGAACLLLESEYKRLRFIRENAILDFEEKLEKEECTARNAYIATKIAKKGEKVKPVSCNSDVIDSEEREDAL